MPPILPIQHDKRSVLSPVRTAGLALLLACFCAVGAQAQQKQQQQLPDGPGKDVMQRVCSGCHGAEIVIGRGLTRDGWTQVVTEMIERGAQGSEDDFGQIVEYLATNFPPKADNNKKSGDGSKLDSDKGSEPAK
jgi:mono/diheme cytochrome c family protein